MLGWLHVLTALVSWYQVRIRKEMMFFTPCSKKGESSSVRHFQTLTIHKLPWRGVDVIPVTHRGALDG